MSAAASKEVPYYHHRFSPEYFRGKGWRGLLVRGLNFLRWKLQVWCAYHVMILLAKRHVRDESTIEAIKLRWNEEQEETSNRRPVLGVFGQMEATFTEPKSRYEEGRKNSKWPNDISPDPTTERFARYLRKPHQAPYTHARDTLLVEEPEWEPVGPMEE